MRINIKTGLSEGNMSKVLYLRDKSVQQIKELKNLLLDGPKNQGDLAQLIRLSQPQISNYLRSEPDSFLKTGNARTTLYFLRKPLFDAEHSWPVYRVTPEGHAEYFADIHSVYPGGFVSYFRKEKTWELTDSLPWWLADMRPQGFMGRSLARQLSAQQTGFPDDPRYWSDADILKALTSYPRDNIGNLIVGDSAYDYWINHSNDDITCLDDLYLYADKAMSGWLGGSSAGGEQPKFACCINNINNPCIVKFSSPLNENNINATRWADLLIAEHVALHRLQMHKLPAAETSLVKKSHDAIERLYLISRRFDRTGTYGRHGIISLKMIDAEFVGGREQRWPMICQSLAGSGMLKPSDIETIKILYCYGKLIGNTDMHSGNLSFFHDTHKKFELCPTYDMLPMYYSPSSNGFMHHDVPQITIDADIDKDAWAAALQLATEFWEEIQNHEMISRDFKCISENFLKTLQTDINQKIERLAFRQDGNGINGLKTQIAPDIDSSKFKL